MELWVISKSSTLLQILFLDNILHQNQPKSFPDTMFFPSFFVWTNYWYFSRNLTVFQETFDFETNENVGKVFLTKRVEDFGLSGEIDNLFSIVPFEF